MSNICKKNHRFNPMFSVLPENQGQTGRHRCAACAHELAMLNKAAGIPISQDDSFLKSIPFSQAGEVRHKDAYTAYQLVYKY